MDSEGLEGLITYTEASNTLKNMKNDKSPGLSEFTTEFFLMFWKNMGHFVVRSLNCVFLPKVSNTQSQGIVTYLTN